MRDLEERVLMYALVVSIRVLVVLPHMRGPNVTIGIGKETALNGEGMKMGVGIFYSAMNLSMAHCNQIVLFLTTADLLHNKGDKYG